MCLEMVGARAGPWCQWWLVIEDEAVESFAGKIFPLRQRLWLKLSYLAGAGNTPGGASILCHLPLQHVPLGTFTRPSLLGAFSHIFILPAAHEEIFLFLYIAQTDPNLHFGATACLLHCCLVQSYGPNPRQPSDLQLANDFVSKLMLPPKPSPRQSLSTHRHRPTVTE